jgi:protein-tyrosine phosphatase
MIDLHSHLLPGLDDGAESAEQALAALRLLAEDGVRAVVLTPHLRASDIAMKGEQAIRERDAALQALRAAAPASPELHPGFEILLDEPLPPLCMGDPRYALCGSRYYLVEFRLSVVASLATRVLEDMGRAGAVPIVAHVERYGVCSPPVITEWKSVGARIQVDATALTRPTSRGRVARELIEAGLVHVLAADNHGDRRSLRTAARFLRQRTAHGPQAAEALIAGLTVENPGAVLANGEMRDLPRFGLRESLGERVRRMLGR